MLLVFVVICLAAGRLGAALTEPALEGWYRGLAKPFWTPPDVVFPVAWSILYVTMGIAAWLVWKTAERGELRLPMTLFFGQLVINVLWSFSFFGQRSPFLGLICLGALVLAVILTTIAFTRVSRAAGWLFLPYLLWLGYAGALNFAIWKMNA
ncbi:TspO/MBR family protein [Pelagibius marinus]|uniref:TspO/MBR family protein n=1 Tax=Pelagibius marinus TaxID=2762760 RepID=UPI00187317F0|nr:TspO/MBR family protein [Pelagibius marinus]